jgi:hypothetical protein
LDDNKDSDATSTETKANVVVAEISLTKDEETELINSLNACTELGHVKELWNNLDPKYQAINHVRKLVTNCKNQLK